MNRTLSHWCVDLFFRCCVHMGIGMFNISHFHRIPGCHVVVFFPFYIFPSSSCILPLSLSLSLFICLYIYLYFCWVCEHRKKTRNGIESVRTGRRIRSATRRFPILMLLKIRQLYPALYFSISTLFFIDLYFFRLLLFGWREPALLLGHQVFDPPAVARTRVPAVNRLLLFAHVSHLVSNLSERAIACTVW